VNVAAVDGREAFEKLPLMTGGLGVFCRNCGEGVQLREGLTDARRIAHADDCKAGRQIAASPKPVFFAASRTREAAPN
jgi:hypothetical protein